MQKIDFFYDYDEDNLYLYKDAKSHGSVEMGEDIVIDFDKKLNVVALEFFNASKVLSDLTNKKITKKMLSKIKNANLISERKRGLLLAIFKMVVDKNTVIEDKLNIQDIKYESPVLAVCK